MNDQEKILSWQKTKDPAIFTDLVQQYNPLIHKTVNQFKTSGLSTPTLKARAHENFINAISSYNPEFKTQPITHITNHLRKVQRYASESITSGRVPEQRSSRMSVYNTIKKNLTEELGRDPSTAEIADELGWSVKQVTLTEKEIGGEVGASGAPTPFFGSAISTENKDLANAEYLYHSNASGPEKVILEHTFGFYGKPILNNKEIAQKLRTNEMAVSRAKKRISEKLKQYR